MVIFSECHLDFKVGLGMGDSYIALIFYNILVYIRLILVKGKLWVYFNLLYIKSSLAMSLYFWTGVIFVANI